MRLEQRELDLPTWQRPVRMDYYRQRRAARRRLALYTIATLAGLIAFVCNTGGAPWNQ